MDLAEQDPEHFVHSNPRGPVKRYAGAELAPFAGETDGVAAGVAEDSTAWPSSQAPIHGDSSTSRALASSGRTTRKRMVEGDANQEVRALEEEATPAQISAMLREISGRLERAEKQQVGPGMLVLIVLLSILIVMLLIAGGLLLAQREGYLSRFFGW